MKTEEKMSKKDKIALVLLAVVLFSALAVVATLCNCGEMSDLQPNVTILNLPPGGTIAGDECDDCPDSPVILNFAAVETGDEYWALALQFETGCDTASDYYWMIAGFWEKIDGEWAKRQDIVWRLNPAAYSCYMDIAYWDELPQPCPGESWCSAAEYKVDLYYMIHDLYGQIFTKPEFGIGGF